MPYIKGTKRARDVACIRDKKQKHYIARKTSFNERDLLVHQAVGGRLMMNVTYGNTVWGRVLY